MRLAAIDVGSNSLHMIVAQVDPDGGVTTLWRMKEPVGLGKLSFPSKRLTRDAMDRAVATLARFQQAAQVRECEKIVTIATSAVREATNGGDFIVRVRDELKLHVRVVSAREEARLIYLAVRHAFPLAKSPALIVDIGGGSVEFIVGNKEEAQLLESRKLGAARITAQFVKSDPLSRDDRKAIQKHFESELGPLFGAIRELKPRAVIGTSGTLESIARMCDPAAKDAREIDRDAFERLLKKLVKSDADARTTIRGLDDGRRDQVTAGALLVSEIFERSGTRKIVMCGAALREGILLDYLGRHLPDLQVRRDVPDVRRRSVLDLARRCHWHKSHSEHVAGLTLQLFDELRLAHGMGPQARELIEYAALLHDIGWHIARDDHHKHSMYLIQHGDLQGFTPDEVSVIANIARYHRKSAPKPRHDRYAALPPKMRQIVDLGAALLRVADGLDRSQSQVVTAVKSRDDGKTINLRVTSRGDAELELWGAKRKADWFEKVMKRQLELESR